MSRRTLLSPGIRSVQNFLHNELSNFQQSPILIVSSEPATTGAVPMSAIKDASRWLHFTLSQNFGLRTVPATISSAFPSVQDLESRIDLLRRTGASSIVAVGSGAAIDLAKTLAAERKDSIEQLLLVPSTHAAMIAAGASHSLLLDSVEETLVSNQSTVVCSTTVAALDPKYFATVDSTIAFYGVLAIVLDAALRRSTDRLLMEVVSEILELVRDGGHDTMSHEEIVSLCFRSSTLLSYGLGSEDRSSPIALASSLIPTIFPHVHILSFWASLVPGLCHALESTSVTGPVQELVGILHDRAEWKNFPKPTVVDEKMKGFSVPDMALSHLQSNSALCKTFDMPNQMLIEILQHSMS